MIFLNPLGALIPKIPFSAEFWVQVTSGAQRSVSEGLWGARQLSFFFEGGLPRWLLDEPPPPPSCLNLYCCTVCLSVPPIFNPIPILTL